MLSHEVCSCVHVVLKYELRLLIESGIISIGRTAVIFNTIGMSASDLTS